MKKWMKAVAALALVGAVAIAAPRVSMSANLTGGSYTYLVQGEEVLFPFDPIVRKEGLLLPIEVFQQFGIKVDGALAREVTLTRGDLTVNLTLGSTSILVSGKKDTVPTPAVRVSGRLFLPADLMRQFGIELTTDGTYVVMRTYVDNLGPAEELSEAAYATLKAPRTVKGNLKADSGIYLDAEFTLLNDELINTANLGLSYGMRAKLLSLLENNTLVLAKVSNTNFKSGALVTSGLYLVDSQRIQYDNPTVLDMGRGLITAKVAPAADRIGILVYPKLGEEAGAVSLYYDANGATIGTFANR